MRKSEKHCILRRTRSYFGRARDYCLPSHFYETVLITSNHSLKFVVLKTLKLVALNYRIQLWDAFSLQWHCESLIYRAVNKFPFTSWILTSAENAFFKFHKCLVSVFVYYKSSRVSAIKCMHFYYRLISVFFHVFVCTLLLPCILSLFCIACGSEEVLQYNPIRLRLWSW